VALFPVTPWRITSSPHYRDLGRGVEMEQELDRTIAITPIAKRRRLEIARRPVGARRSGGNESAPRPVPARVRSLERVVFSAGYAMATGQWEEGRIALED